MQILSQPGKGSKKKPKRSKKTRTDKKKSTVESEWLKNEVVKINTQIEKWNKTQEILQKMVAGALQTIVSNWQQFESNVLIYYN